MNTKTNGSGIDPLTGLNDRSILPYLNDRFSSREHPWSLVMIDIDHFKLVNDIYGHLAGDEILAHVGQTVKVNLKSEDYALRFGGDEFIVVLPDTSGDNALDLAQRLLFEFRKKEFPGGMKVSVSMGIAQSKLDDQEISDLISMADQALYHAKDTGRGRFVLAEELINVKDIEPEFSHMVGRRDELLQLRKLVDNAIAGSAEFCILTGFQGTGKTKLVEELLNYCQFKNMPVFTTKVHPVFQEESYLVISIVRKALNGLTEDQMLDVKSAIGPVEQSTRKQFSEFNLIETKSSFSAASDEKKARNRNDLGTILREVSRITPFVVVLDNLQWASRKCIQFVAEAISSVPKANILYIGMSRISTTLKLLEPIWASVPLKSIHLQPLEPADVRTMVFFAIKTPEIPDEVQDYMMRQSGGNALFLRKLISWSLEMGYLSLGKGATCLWEEPEEDKLPDDICSVIEIMLGKCSPEEMKVLKRAALVGKYLDLPLLRELTSMDEFDLAEILDRFVEMGLIKDNGTFFTFSYGVMRSLLISKISPSFRMILHEKTAVFMEKNWEVNEHLLLEAIAYHFCNSKSRMKAVEYSRRAANETFSMGLHSESIHWYQEYLSKVSDASDQVGFLQAHINLGDLLSLTGKTEPAEEHLKTALSLTEDPEDMCAIYYSLGKNYQRRSMYPDAAKYFMLAVSTGNSAGAQTGILVNNMIGAHLETSFIYRQQSKHKNATEQLKLANKLFNCSVTGIDKALEGMYFARLADLENETGSPEKALEQYQKGLKICVKENDQIGEALILNNMHNLYTYSGDYNSMLDCLKQVIKLNNRLGDQLGLAIGYYNLAETYTQLNMLDLAERYFQMYIELNSKIDNRIGMAYGQFGLGMLSMVTGRNNQACSFFLNASLIFAEMNCTEMECDSELNRVKALLELKDYRTCSDILSAVKNRDLGPLLQNWLLHLEGVLLHRTGSSQEELTKAVAMIKRSAALSDKAPPDGIVYMYGNLLTALEREDRSEEIAPALKNAVDLLEVKLLSIKSESILKSILSRSDMEKFLDLCRKEEIASSLLNS
ncbi:MAG: diguanylate cyclase [Candidatus Sabulitectum sp.]|nr:diguanylate cyclase [Candidatus Sabulitectum sp.]